MNWEEQLKSLTIGTLFKFFGKALVASILWYVLLMVIMMVPMFIIMAVFGLNSL